MYFLLNYTKRDVDFLWTSCKQWFLQINSLFENICNSQLRDEETNTALLFFLG